MKRYLFALFVILGSLILVAQAQAQVIVIANSSVKTSEISKADLRDVFTGNAVSFPGGGSVAPALLKAGAVHEEFLRTYIGKNDTTFRAGWRSLVFSGQVIMPKSLDSDTAVVDFVVHNNGAIGYIGKATAHEGVKVLTVR